MLKSCSCHIILTWLMSQCSNSGMLLTAMRWWDFYAAICNVCQGVCLEQHYLLVSVCTSSNLQVSMSVSMLIFVRRVHAYLLGQSCCHPSAGLDSRNYSLHNQEGCLLHRWYQGNLQPLHILWCSQRLQQSNFNVIACPSMPALDAFSTKFLYCKHSLESQET